LKLDGALLKRPGNGEVQLDLFLDYASNVALYPKFREYFRSSRPPTLAVWGDSDPFFVPAGAEAFKRDNPDTEVRFSETSHFESETHYPEISCAIQDVLDRKLTTRGKAA
jgi:pimeloyl-ACP methyl ester carboxylesterase